MRRYASAALLGLALLWGCSHSVLVPVPPRMALDRYGTLGIVEFTSNAERGTSARATRQFQEQVQGAQPGTPFLELGDRDSVLAAVGATQLDPAALRKIGEKYGVRAVFVGDLVYSAPRMDIKLPDVTRLEGGVRAEMRGDIASRLLDTATGASVWSGSAWARRQIGSVHVSAERGLSGGMSQSNPREEMLPGMLYQLTHDFRPSSVRQQVR